MAGDPDVGARFLPRSIAPLRWPEGGLDAAAVREIRRIKARVEAERLPRGADPALHTKLGRGGLADVEWTVQLLQLQWAHEHPGLRTTGTLEALDAIGAAELLDADDVATLAAAWQLATRVRNAIILFRGRAADSLPTDARELTGVARAVGYPAGHTADLDRGLPPRHEARPRGRGEDVLRVTPAAAPAKPRMHRREVAVDGVRFVVDRSDPPRRRRTTPALLLHGVPETRAMWRPLAEELARDRIVLAPDLKGLGESEVRGPYDIPTLVRELAALVLHEVDGRVDVVGHDWGGSLALALALKRPDLVRRLVVINAPYKYIDFAHAWHMPLFALPLIPEAVFALGGRSVAGWMLDRGWRSTTPIDPELREQYAAAYSDPRRVAAMLAYYRAAIRGRLVRAARETAGRVRASRRYREPVGPPHSSGGDARHLGRGRPGAAAAGGGERRPRPGADRTARDAARRWTLHGR